MANWIALTLSIGVVSFQLDVCWYFVYNRLKTKIVLLKFLPKVDASNRSLMWSCCLYKRNYAKVFTSRSFHRSCKFILIITLNTSRWWRCKFLQIVPLIIVISHLNAQFGASTYRYNLTTTYFRFVVCKYACC